MSKSITLLVATVLFGSSAVKPQNSVLAPRLAPEDIVRLQNKADEGDADAQLELGRAYATGNGVSENAALAVKWYTAAAKQGNAKAEESLGSMLRSGRGTDQNKAEAINWYKKAALQRNAAAMYNLGTAYYNGDGVGADNVLADAWFLLASNFGSAPATEAAKRINEEIRDVQPKALEEIGDMFHKGDGVPQSDSDAIAWYRKAAEDGSASLQIKLANLLLNQGGNRNYEEVRDLCEKATKQRSSTGPYCLGQLYQNGLGVPHDPSEAARFFKQAAEMGLALGMLRLGEMYWKGEGLKQDNISAYEYISLASSSDLPKATEEKKQLEKELTVKEVRKGQSKAVEWIHTHHPLVLRDATAAK